MWAFRPLLWYSSIFLLSGTQLFAFSANISLFSGAFYFIFWRSIAQCKNWKQQPAFIFHVCLDEPVNCEDCCLPGLWHHIVMEVYWHFRGLCHSRILQNVSALYETTQCHIREVTAVRTWIVGYSWLVGICYFSSWQRGIKEVVKVSVPFFYLLSFSCTIYTAPAWSVAVLWDLKYSISRWYIFKSGSVFFLVLLFHHVPSLWGFRRKLHLVIYCQCRLKPQMLQNLLLMLQFQENHQVKL